MFKNYTNSKIRCRHITEHRFNASARAVKVCNGCEPVQNRCYT